MKNLFNYFLIVLLTISSCKKEEEIIHASTNTFTPTKMTCIKGIVLGQNGNPIVGVNVNIESSTLSTSTKGLFSFNNINTSTDRTIIHFEKDGYFKTSRALETKEDVANYIRIVMDLQQINGTFNSSSGSSLALNNGVTIDLPGGSYSYNDGSTFYGDINVSVNKISPGGSNFTMRIPGGDLRAITTNGDDMRLYSYGMLDVVLTDYSGQEINMGASTQITLPIPNNMLADAPSQIPLWHYDDLTGIWMEEGYAIRSGNVYVGNVSHFSHWNWDYPTQEAGVKGRILDCEGSLLANVLVIIGQQSTSTNSNGDFEVLVPSGQNLLVKVIDNFGDTLFVTVPPLSPMTMHDAGDITICNSAIIEGKVIDCNGNPAQNILVFSPFSPFTYAYSDLNGNFSFFFPENISTTIFAEGFFGTISSPVSTPQLSSTQVYNAGTIVMCEGTSTTTVAQDKQDISNTFASMENCVSSLKNGFGATALKNFLNLDEGNVLSENWIDDMIDNIDGLLDLDAK